MRMEKPPFQLNCKYLVFFLLLAVFVANNVTLICLWVEEHWGNKFNVAWGNSFNFTELAANLI